jgi:hypothetical protein
VSYSGYVNRKEWAESQGVSATAAHRWHRDGTRPVSARRVGRLILVDPVAVYAWVSSADQRSDLDGQVTRATAGVTGRNRQPRRDRHRPGGEQLPAGVPRPAPRLHDSQQIKLVASGQTIQSPAEAHPPGRNQAPRSFRSVGNDRPPKRGAHLFRRRYVSRGQVRHRAPVGTPCTAPGPL